MRKALAAVALLAILPSAHAQDKAKADIGFNGEYRLRDSWMMNSSGLDGSDKNTIYSRFKLEANAKATDKLSATLTLMHNANFGAHTDQMNTPDGTAGAADMLTVNQAYANWMTSDDFSFKAGRMNYQIADGTLIGTNDWEAVPYAFDGVLGNYEVQFGRFQVFAFKYAELSNVAGAAAGRDEERNAYGINFDLKTMPEVLKSVNVHVIKDNANAVTAIPGKDLVRYGLNVNLSFNIVDVKAWYEGMSGKNKPVAATSRNANGTMMQAEVGVNFPMFMTSRLFVKYHQDSGDTDATDDKDQAYDPYFYEKHASAGHMDLLKWGNLTFVQIGWQGKPMDNTEVGLNYWMFTRTKKGTGSSAVMSGMNYAYTNTDLEKDKLGDEIDLWAAHHYNANLSTIIRLGYFSPGSVFTSDAAMVGTNKQNKNPMEVFVEGRLTF